MNTTLNIFLILILLLQIVLIVSFIKRKKLTMKYASLWLFLIFIMILVVIFPTIVFKLSELSGFEKTSNMIFLLGFFFLFYIVFIITASISIQNIKIKKLTQELSILKESINKYGKKE